MPDETPRFCITTDYTDANWLIPADKLDAWNNYLGQMWNATPEKTVALVENPPTWAKRLDYPLENYSFTDFREHA